MEQLNQKGPSLLVQKERFDNMNSFEIKNDFPLLANSNITYLDSAATTQRPKVVIDKIKNFYEKYNANSHRGAYSLSIEATNLYEKAREDVAKFINAKSSEEIIFSKNATESLNLVAMSWGLQNLKSGNEFVLSIMEHHSNLVPWQIVTKKTNSKLSYMYINENYEIPDEEIEKKITSRTKIVGITYVSNVLGTINPIAKIIKKAHSVGAKVVVDASQAIPHFPIDVQALDVDFLAFSGHKMLAPFGVGVLYGKKEILNKMQPFITGGGMIEYVYEQDATYAPLPEKFEAGTQNAEAVIGLGSAINYINSIGFENIQKIDNSILDYARAELSKLPFLTLYMPSRENHSSVISFNINGVHPHDVASILDNYGVCIRSGNHCAQPLLRSLNIDSTCRASFYIYNTKQDVDSLVFALNKAYKMFEKYLKKD